MQITSPALDQGKTISPKYTCDGENVNPPLLIADVPAEAKSLVLVMDDPDAPSGNFTHWTVWNIDPSTTEIPEDSVPEDAVEGMTSFGTSGYGGPCPTSGTHRYYFKLYALDAALDLSVETEADELEEAVESHLLEQAELMGRYGRAK